MKTKTIVTIIICLTLSFGVYLLLRPTVGSTGHRQIHDELKNEILTAYFQELEFGANLVRLKPWIDIYGGQYTADRYKPAIRFDPLGRNMRVMTGRNSWIVYEIHLDQRGSSRMNSVFVEESRYPPK